MNLQKAFDAGFEAVKAYLDDALGAFEDRIRAVEAREPVKGDCGEPGADGRDADPEAIAALVRDEVVRAIAAIPAPQDGKSVTVEDVEPLIAERVTAFVTEAVKAIPVPVNGKDGRDGIDGRDGKSVEPADIEPMLRSAVAEAVAEIPVPKDGRDGVDGKDGRNGLDAVTPILKDGVLLFTMSDGSLKEVGPVCGRDGQDGSDGKDGVGFDDLTAEYDGERTITLKMQRGEKVKEFSFDMPVVLDRGVYKEGQGYQKGDAVTWAGSVWIAQKDTDQKPDSGDGWRLSVKRGRDGKPGKDGEIKGPSAPVKVGR